jgi:hypothetical protein
MTFRLLANLLRALDAVEVSYWRREAALLSSLGPMGAEWMQRHAGKS